MSLERVLNEFTERNNIPAVEPDDKGVYTFIVDGTMQVSCMSLSTKEAVIFAPVMELPEEETARGQKLESLLKLNFARVYEQDEILSIEPETNKLILFRRVSLDEIDTDSFTEVFEEFLNSLEFWITRAKDSTDATMPSGMRFFFP